MGPEARAAVQVDADAARHFVQAEAQLVEGEVESSRHMAILVLADVANVKDQGGRAAVLGRREGCPELGRGLERAEARDVVLSHEGRDVHGVVRGGEGRSVRKVELGEVVQAHFAVESRREDVYPLLHPLRAEGLGAEQPRALAVVDELEDELLGPGIIGGVVVLEDDGRARRRNPPRGRLSR